jgi:predicted adenylyl cyclase CyaB
VLQQQDTFFAAGRARLKLRMQGAEAELIAYRRQDVPDVRGSEYQLYRTENPAGLLATLTHALGVAGKVVKQRDLYLFRSTRIHLDQVEGLGSFVELETVMSDQSEGEARAELEELARALGLGDEERVAEPYVALLEAQLPYDCRGDVLPSTQVLDEHGGRVDESPRKPPPA